MEGNGSRASMATVKMFLGGGYKERTSNNRVHNGENVSRPSTLSSCLHSV